MKIAVTGSKCTVTVSGQTRTGMEYLNAGSGANATVTAKANLSGLTYQVANGKECTGAPADGSYSNGKYIGGTSMSITNIGE
jgi:hypothetical protein